MAEAAHRFERGVERGADGAGTWPRVVVELLTDARFYGLPRREADLVIKRLAN
jgi:hypothetical protein